MNARARIAVSTLLSLAGIARAQFTESFDAVSQFSPGSPQGMTLPGWTFQNSANPTGTTGMYNGIDTLGMPFVFPQQGGTGFLAANFNNTTNANTISTWAISPMTLLKNGGILRFWTRTVDAPVTYPDRIQVRLSVSGVSTNVGPLLTPTAVGDFTTLLLDINPAYTMSDFPSVWTEYTITLSGLPASGVNGRFALRYFVENGGPSGINSDYTGFDTLSYTLPAPPPPCYANCDGVGSLTGNDFQCFLNAYVAGQSYANCDGVGGLTGNDFQCFLDKYVAGCS